MDTKTIRVRGLVACGGEWGNIYEGAESDIPVTVYESLRRAGYVEPVDPADEQALFTEVADEDEGTETETKIIDPSVISEKKESRPRAKSKRAKKS